MVCLPQIISEGVVDVLDELLPIGWSTVVGANEIAFSTADFRAVSSINRPTHKVDPDRYGIPVPSRPYRMVASAPPSSFGCTRVIRPMLSSVCLLTTRIQLSNMSA